MINAEVSAEGPECIVEGEGGEKLPAVKKKRLKRKLSTVMFLTIRFARITSYPVPTDVKIKLCQ